MRLIDADNLIGLCNIMADKCSEAEAVMWGQFAEVVMDVPTIDPVKHGRWNVWVDDENISNCICTCSVCGVVYCIEDFSYHEANYCPNCGAKMDGGEE